MNAEGSTVDEGPMNEHEIGQRIAMIESMMREGRRRTEYWGWNFLLWGVAYLVAVGWSSFLPGRMLAWPVTMIFAVLLTILIARKRMRHEPKTDRSRALGAIWMGMGWGIFAFAFPAAYSGHFEAHSFMAAIEAMLGIGHVASGLTLRWPVQIAVGGLWWVAAIVSCFVPTNNGVAYIFLGAVLVCNIGFGTYLMIRESRDRARAQRAGVQHA